MIFVGVERKQGTFEGRGYDNHIAHFVTDEKTPSLLDGKLTLTKKVKTADWPLICDPSVKPGMEVIVQFNQYGNLCSIRPAKQSG